MRIVVTIDGELLASLGYNTGLKEQKAAIARMVDAMGHLLLHGDEIVICHGNAPQVGAMLLRSEAARHMIYDLPLDVCGADTQGATGYMLQQALQNWLEVHAINRDVVTLITQVVIEEPVLIDSPMDANRNSLSSIDISSKKGVGPFFDKELAHTHQITRGWELGNVSGYGYQRLVPLLRPKKIVEGKSIHALVEHGTIIICAGGGGVPVRKDPGGQMVGVEAVVDKAFTAVLLAMEIQADSILFVTPLENLLGVLGPGIEARCRSLDLASLEGLIRDMSSTDPIQQKLIASRDFLLAGGKSVLIIPSEELARLPQASYGVFLGSGEVLIIKNWDAHVGAIS